MKVSQFSVRHPVIIGMILIALALFGIYSISSTNVEFMGGIEMPQIYVIAVWPGASAEDIEDSVVNVLEENFVTLPDFRGVSSTSSNSVGSVIISFADGVDVNDKINEVRNRVRELENDLPDGLSGLPQCIIGDVTMLPVISFSVYGGEDLASVSSYIEDSLVPQLTQISGVSTVEVSGTVKPRVSVHLKLAELDAKGVSPLAVYQMVSYSYNALPLGTSYYEEKMVTVEYNGKFNSLDEIRNLPVGASDDGSIIHLGDVADVKLDYEDRGYT
ncbi:MAG: efflux RND transporter permease subunit, partial [Spirochaetales bacterium]|nr:efflux RND transporter permease subunit [Candidatus Physcosoma equi]